MCGIERLSCEDFIVSRVDERQEGLENVGQGYGGVSNLIFIELGTLMSAQSTHQSIAHARGFLEQIQLELEELIGAVVGSVADHLLWEVAVAGDWNERIALSPFVGDIFPCGALHQLVNGK